MLTQLLAHPFRLQSIFAPIERLQHNQCTPNKTIVGGNAAQARPSFIRDDSDQRVHTVIRLQFVTPSALRSGTTQTYGSNLAYFHFFLLDQTAGFL